MKETPSQSYGDLELDVLSILWNAETPLLVSQVHERLQVDRKLAYTTVLTVLGNLHKKAAVDRAKRGKAHLYWAVQKREQAASGLFQNLLQRIYNNNPADMLAGFIRSNGPLTAKEIDKLKAELDRLEESVDE